MLMAVGLLLVVGGAYIYRATWRNRNDLVSGQPVYDGPSSFDLGNQEQSSSVVVRFKIRNKGNAELKIGDVRTNCQCTGLERETATGFEPVDSAVVPPGGALDLCIHVTVRGQVGAPFERTIYLGTNDPEFPEVALPVRVRLVTGGVRTVPTSVQFGTVQPGAECERFFDIYDDSVQPRAIREVSGWGSPRLSVAVLPPVADQQGGKLPIARVRLKADPSSPGPLDGDITVLVDGADRPPVVVHVTGRVAGLVDTHPSEVVLPLFSASGRIYSTTCRCRSGSGTPIALKLESRTEGLTVRVEPVNGGSVWAVSIELAPESTRSGTRDRRTVHLMATLGGRNIPVDIPVICRGD